MPLENENLETIQSFNIYAFLPTLVFFAFGLIYYFYKFQNIREHVNNSNVMNANTTSQREIDNQSSNNIGSIPPNSNNEIDIFIIIDNQRKHFRIDKNLIISNFIDNHIKPSIQNFSNEKTIYLICQGRRLDFSKKISDYTNIENNTVLHCFISINTENSRVPRQDQEEQTYSQLQIDEQAVSVYTLVAHFFIFLFVVLTIISYKNVKEYISKGAVLIFQLMAILWVTQFSKCIAKVAINKKIVFN
jgi:hypothetical protein